MLNWITKAKTSEVQSIQAHFYFYLSINNVFMHLGQINPEQSQPGKENCCKKKNSLGYNCI